jgi:hypothetical protein
MPYVYSFKSYDIVRDEIMVSKCKATTAFIGQTGCELVPESAEMVDDDKLDEHGRYYPEKEG